MKSLADIPSSVYRLQFSEQFTLKDAINLLPYLHKLGIEGIYCSPIFEANSVHGYDVTDPTRLNAKLGTMEDYLEFCKLLKEYKMHQILDVIPNHMSIKGQANKWWLDVLENGPHATSSIFFDIDWDPENRDLKDKVLLPILHDNYGKVLENQDIQLIWQDGFWIIYQDYQLPLNLISYASILEYPIDQQLSENESREWIACLDIALNLKKDNERELEKQKLIELYQSSSFIQKKVENLVSIFNGKKGDSTSFDPLHNLLDAQWYRLANWQVAGQEINYRRFFNINELIGIHIENDNVLNLHHQWIFELLKSGQVQGLRIDHPDGLYDPTEYFNRLMQHSPPLLVVEKILDFKESLPLKWKVDGTVGYDFLNVLNGLFIQKKKEKQADRNYEKFLKSSPLNLDDLLYARKKKHITFHMSSDINSLGWRLNKLSEVNRYYRDFTNEDLTKAIEETIATFPVYRTYIRPNEEISSKDENCILQAIEKAKYYCKEIDLSVFDYLRDVLLNRLGHFHVENELLFDFIQRFQQLTGPAMAKGLEDSLFYIYNRLLSLNEVGGNPKNFGFSKNEFHQFNSEKLKNWPLGFLATSTHDTKRNFDVRMRINVLSEIPEKWYQIVNSWKKENHKYKTLINKEYFPDNNTEYYIYQTLLGIWNNNEDKETLLERIWTALEKSIREAGVYTNWRVKNEMYENAVKQFLFSILTFNGDNQFLSSFLNFQKEINDFGCWSSLSSLVLKMGCPGIIDIYQGNELWHYCLMDPDNRRPIDFATRIAQLEKSSDLKFFITTECLKFRKQHKSLFLQGSYEPLSVTGDKKENVIAFLRTYEKEQVIVLSARFFTELLNEPLGELCWGDTTISLPKTVESREFFDIFSKSKININKKEKKYTVKVADIFSQFPFAILSNF